MKTQVRRNATRKYDPGTVFIISDAWRIDRPWILLKCESETAGHGYKLTLRTMTKNEEIVRSVMKE